MREQLKAAKQSVVVSSKVSGAKHGERSEGKQDTQEHKHEARRCENAHVLEECESS